MKGGKERVWHNAKDKLKGKAGRNMETPEHYGLNTILVNCAFPWCHPKLSVASPRSENMGAEIWQRRKLAHGGRERYRDALYRHLLEYLDDPAGVDTETACRIVAFGLQCSVLCELEYSLGLNKKGRPACEKLGAILIYATI